ncbi:MAG: hypothetical protein L6V95_06210 [Candidatus Melainabacteria bacterium]|nr:MAG: hypothetical protein L6V95_06210 [Candidatus Melainabacteria bacterium]
MALRIGIKTTVSPTDTLTVVGYKNNKNNELVFILNDTDDEYQKPIEMKAKI